jgi:hypothetical protein
MLSSNSFPGTGVNVAATTITFGNQVYGKINYLDF